MRKISLYDERIRKTPYQTITRGREIRIALKLAIVNEDLSHVETALKLLTDESAFDLDISPNYEGSVRYEFPNQFTEDIEEHLK